MALRGPAATAGDPSTSAARTAAWTTVRVWARPSARSEGVRWDAWRKRWVVSVRAAAVGGAANRAVLDLIARRLGLSTSEVRFVHAGTAPPKSVEVHGLPEEEIRRRLGGSEKG